MEQPPEEPPRLDPFERLCEQARNLIDIDRAADAIPLITQALALAPDSAYAHCHLALAYVGQCNYGEALRLAVESLKRDPDYEWAHRLRSMNLRRMGAHREAYEAALEARRLAPEEPLTLSCLYYAEMALYEAEESELRFAVLSDGGEMPPVPLPFGVPWRWLGRALESARMLLDLAPDSAGAHRLMGEALTAANRQDEAAACFERALRINPESPRALNQRGQLYLKEGRVWLALKLFTMARTLAPTEPEYQMNVQLAQSRLKQGSWRP